MSARFALLALLVLPSVATAEPVSPGLARRLEEKCATCHDADHPTLNLETALPPVDDHAAWTRILDAVETYRMPPAAPGGSRMDPAIRQEILDDVGRILGHDADGPVEPR